MSVQHDSGCVILFPGDESGKAKIKVGSLVYTVETARDLVKCLEHAIEKIDRINPPTHEYLIFIMEDLTKTRWMEMAYPIMARSPVLAAEKFALSCGDVHKTYILLVDDQEGTQHIFDFTLSTRLGANVLQVFRSEDEMEDLDETD